MTDLKIVPLDAAKTDASDGRRQRSERSRAQIIEAMFALIREGEMSPSAARVAERAEVGLRTVFRHFEDMDSLYVEMAERIHGEVMPKVLAPFEAKEWRERFFEHLDRRIAIYEHVLPVRVSANLRRFQSRFLMEEYRRNLLMERSALMALLPEEISRDPVLFAAIETSASFQTWRRLRQDSDLSPEDARAVFRLVLERLIGK
ncbi:MAG: TetR/AcrR family transcriptional regulator [Hyphomonas sp.]|jgi:AcrR family transcriptional regulator|nr:TetR/AcrR family transcriptional regulator [Hyphomonas sp.]